MMTVGWVLVALPVLLAGYAYLGYPLLLWLLSRFRRAPQLGSTGDWPHVTLSLPVFNEGAQIRAVMESLLRLDYPQDRLTILVVSDASTDDTDEIVKEYAGAGVRLLRMPQRVGKTAAENAGAEHITSDITVNTDASIRIRPDALKRLVARFADPTVGVASGRDISVAPGGVGDANTAEASYVGYEMWVRSLESRLGGIIGASGCFYAIRAHLHRQPLPAHLSRDFASAMVAREHGYRAVSVDDALCLVPRTGSLTREYQRKVRTMSRGIETLLYKRHLLNPLRYGAFAWKLASHKVCRWLVPWFAALGAVGMLLLVTQLSAARWLSSAGIVSAASIWIAWRANGTRPLPRLLALFSSIAVAQLATMHALMRALHGDQNAAWEPTRREHTIPAEHSPA
jgi:cellulose synthase/poly-beta-1,6-N-acetylglucosamine synthase-like glycosyltransferase